MSLEGVPRNPGRVGSGAGVVRLEGGVGRPPSSFVHFSF